MVTSSAVVGSSAMSTCGSQAKRYGDNHPLAHPAGELVRVLLHAVLGVGDTDKLQ